MDNLAQNNLVTLAYIIVAWVCIVGIWVGNGMAKTVAITGITVSTLGFSAILIFA